MSEQPAPKPTAVPPAVDAPDAGQRPSVSSVRAVTDRVLLGLLTLLLILAVHIGFAQIEIFGFSVPLIVFACGAIGGFVSIQRRMKQLTEDDLQLMKDSWVYTVLAPFVGGVLAVLLYLLFLSGLLRGDLFPEFVTDGSMRRGFDTIFGQRGDNFHAYGKLLFWSFVAGYSEQFVTDIIGSFEKKTGT